MIKVNKDEITLDGKLLDVMTELSLAVSSWWEFVVDKAGEEFANDSLNAIMETAKQKAVTETA